MLIRISWLLMKSADLDLQCFQKIDKSGFSKKRMKKKIKVIGLNRVFANNFKGENWRNTIKVFL